jgi:hypothetical protein
VERRSLPRPRMQRCAVLNVAVALGKPGAGCGRTTCRASAQRLPAASANWPTSLRRSRREEAGVVDNGRPPKAAESAATLGRRSWPSRSDPCPCSQTRRAKR